MTTVEFGTKYAPYAIEAGRRYGINPVIILAVASFETALASSYSSKIDNNFFGITAGSSTSPHWNGKSRKSTVDPVSYRVYSNVASSFLDFGWLLTTAGRYKGLAELSYDPIKFAAAFTQSGYMTGNKEEYRKSIISRSKTFTDTVRLAQPTSGNGSVFVWLGGLTLFSLWAGKRLFRSGKQAPLADVTE